MKRVNIQNTTNSFTAISNVEIAIKIRSLSFNQGKNLKEFMLQYSKRAVINADEDIRATDPDSFVNDLIKYKHITVEDDSVAMN